jgi:hypothetical protein
MADKMSAVSQTLDRRCSQQFRRPSFERRKLALAETRHTKGALQDELTGPAAQSQRGKHLEAKGTAEPAPKKADYLAITPAVEQAGRQSDSQSAKFFGERSAKLFLQQAAQQFSQHFSLRSTLQ